MAFVEDFIRDENLKLYRRALAESSDEERRRVLLVLLRLLVDKTNEPPKEPVAE
jgi:hypothetical protein